MKKYDVIVVGGGFAGTAAAISVKDNANVKDIDINELRSTLKANGAVC